MTFPEQNRPIVTEPEGLIAAGLMPQVPHQGEPYRKLDRFPEGWQEFGYHVLSAIQADHPAEYGPDAPAPLTERRLTLLAARQWSDHADADRPQRVVYRAAVIGVSDTEGADPVTWFAADLDQADRLAADDMALLGLSAPTDTLQEATAVFDVLVTTQEASHA